MENKHTLDRDEIIEQLKVSGLSVRKFTESRGISYHSLNNRIRKKRERAKRGIQKAPGFIQLPVRRETLKDLKPGITLTVDEKSITIRIRFES